MAKKKFYVVKNGKVPGIYDNWPDCQAQVNGFSGAIYKSFSTIEDAEAFLNDTPIKENKPDGMIAYVDGSYNEGINTCGFGVYIEDDSAKYVFYGKFTQTDGGRNVEGEVMAGLVAAKFAHTLKKPITIYHDYQGIGSWARGEWQRNKTYTKSYYADIQNMIKEGLNVNFIHVDGHSNVRGNEYVDRLAKYACGVPLSESDMSVLLNEVMSNDTAILREITDMTEFI